MLPPPFTRNQGATRRRAAPFGGLTRPHWGHGPPSPHREGAFAASPAEPPPKYLRHKVPRTNADAPTRGQARPCIGQSTRRVCIHCAPPDPCCPHHPVPGLTRDLFIRQRPRLKAGVLPTARPPAPASVPGRLPLKTLHRSVFLSARAQGRCSLLQNPPSQYTFHRIPHSTKAAQHDPSAHPPYRHDDRNA